MFSLIYSGSLAINCWKTRRRGDKLHRAVFCSRIRRRCSLESIPLPETDGTWSSRKPKIHSLYSISSISLGLDARLKSSSSMLTSSSSVSRGSCSSKDFHLRIHRLDPRRHEEEFAKTKVDRCVAAILELLLEQN